MAKIELHTDVLSHPLSSVLTRQLLLNVSALGFQGVVAAIDVVFIALLGTEALAAVALVFPCLALMLTVAASGFGAATSARIAQAVGRGDVAAARVELLAGGLLTLVYGGLWTVALLTWGERLYSYLGAQDVSLVSANQYSGVVFGGAVVTCISQLLLGAMRGFGNAAGASLLATVGGVVQIVITPVLMLGLAGNAPLGIVGAGIGFVSASAPIVIIGPIVVARHVGRPARLAAHNAKVDLSCLLKLLSIALPASINGVLNNLFLLCLAAFVGSLGSGALAAFGVVSRIEYVGFLMVFGAGVTTVTFVAMNYGAGQIDRAQRAMWYIAKAMAVLSAIGLVIVAISPTHVTALFTADQDVRDAANLYIRSSLIGFPFLSFGLVVYYASIALSKPVVPVINNSIRLIVMVVLVSNAMHYLDAGLMGIGLSVALSSAVYCLLMWAWSIRAATWRRSPQVRAA